MNALSIAFNSMLRGELEHAGSATENHHLPAQHQALFEDAITNPSAYGLTNVTDSLLYSDNPNQPGYLFWDEVHPTTQVHQLIAQTAAASMVPEPSSFTLVMIGGGTLVAVRRVRLRARKAA